MPIGVEVNTRTSPPAAASSTLTDTLFVPAALGGSGPIDKPYLIRSIADLEATFSITRATSGPTGVVWDYLDDFFREGGRRAYVKKYTTGSGKLAEALATFDVNLGPGQVVAPSETANATTYGALLAHAAASNRFALLDVGNGDTISAMTTLGTAYLADANLEYGFLCGPWVNVPPPAFVVGGTARTVHASASVAALMARADLLGNPNRAAAGRDFPLQYATSLVTTLAAADRDTLLASGVNAFAERYGVLQLCSFQTGVTQADYTPFWQANCVRARMWLKARALVAGENYMFKPIDGRGLLANALKHELNGICLDLYNVNGLYGATPNDAFAIEVGVAVNTSTTVAQGELHATISARLSLHARRVLIDLVTVPITGTVA